MEIVFYIVTWALLISTIIVVIFNDKIRNKFFSKEEEVSTSEQIETNYNEAIRKMLNDKTSTLYKLIEEQKIRFEDSIDIFLPNFKNLKVLKSNSKSINDVQNVQKIPTIKDLLLHTAGFSYNFLDDPIGKKYHQSGLFYSKNSTLEDEINLLSTIPLLYEPGTRWVYSVSVDILARIIEIITSSTLQNELKKRIFNPLEMYDTGFNIDDNNQSRLMTSYHYDLETKQLINPKNHPRKISNYDYPINDSSYSRGGIGLYSTVNDYFKFAQMLHLGKSKSGNIIVKKETLEMATKNQIPSEFLPFEIKSFDIKQMDENIFEPYGWGFGFRVMMYPEKNEGIGSVGEFGWGGAASTYFLVDPKNNLTAVLMTQVFEGDIILLKDFIQTIYNHLT